jgi:DNA-binding CsgD family transcriptional regulator
VDSSELARNPLRGRDHEVAIIDGRLTELGHGRGSVLLIEAAPGSGKTRLLAETASMARRRGVRVLVGTGDPDGQMMPLSPLLHALCSGPEPILSADAVRLLPTAADQRFWLLLELQEQLERAALVTPLLICLDDLHWCDPATLLVLRSLPERLSSHAIMWVLASRVNTGPFGARETVLRLRAAGATTLRLGAIDDNALQLMVTDLLSVPADESLLQLTRRAEGRPLLIAELLRGLADEGRIAIHANGAQLVGEGLPVQFRESIRHRFLSMSPTAVQAVQMASIFGRHFTIEQLAQMLDVEPVNLLEPIQEATRADLLIEDDSRLSFRHELIREAIEHSVPAAMRRSLRRKLVDVQLRRGVPLTEVALALAETATLGDDDAVALLRQAANALAETSPLSAALLSSRALENTREASPMRPALVAETILLLVRAGQISEARAMADSALHDLLEPAVEAQVRLGLVRAAAAYGTYTDAIEQSRIGGALPAVEPEIRSELTDGVPLHLVSMGEVEQAEEELRLCVPWAQRRGDLPGDVMIATAESQVAFYRGDWTAALRIAEESIDLHRTNPHYGLRRAAGEAWYAIALSMAGRCDEAIASSDAGLRESQRRGNAGAIGLWQMTRARILLDTGRLADAQVEAESTLGINDGVDAGNRADVMRVYTLGRVALWTGDRDGIRRCALDAERMMADAAVSVRGAGSWLAALIADSQGDFTRAMQVTTEAAERIDRLGPWLSSPLDPTDSPAFVRIAMRAGQPEQGRRAVLAAERLQAMNPTVTILAATAVHARGLLEQDGVLLQKAAELFAGSPRNIAHASACEDAAQYLSASAGELAVDYLLTALMLYESAGDERDAGRVRRRLREHGVHKRRTTPGPDAHGWLALTPAELQVVHLVAEGATNRVVAERLFLSPHTVNTHLRHAFTKLNISSRVELTRIVLANDRV